jgi:hypothetical protein
VERAKLWTTLAATQVSGSTLAGELDALTEEASEDLLATPLLDAYQPIAEEVPAAAASSSSSSSHCSGGRLLSAERFLLSRSSVPVPIHQRLLSSGALVERKE